MFSCLSLLIHLDNKMEKILLLLILVVIDGSLLLLTSTVFKLLKKIITLKSTLIIK